MPLAQPLQSTKRRRNAREPTRDRSAFRSLGSSRAHHQLSETNDHRPTPPDEERSFFTEPRRHLTVEEDIPRANPWVTLAFVPAGLIAGMVILVIFTFIFSTVIGGFPVGAAQIYPFAAFCVFGVWLSGKVFRRRPRWWSYVIVAVVAILANVNCQVGGFGFCIS